MAQVKKKNPLNIMVIILLVMVTGLVIIQLFWPPRLDENGKLTRFGGGSDSSGGGGSGGDGATLNTEDPQMLESGDNPDTRFIE